MQSEIRNPKSAIDLILGTAGHIDHGKTSLVKALTGVDTDRLPEEKARGITIDIGFAELDLGEFRFGLVDVPGHERFIKNMLAGSTGIDLALLVIAADDGIMPQTREHLDILKFLGVRAGVIALTKLDLVDAESRELVELEIRDLVRGSFLETAAIVGTSVFTGTGIEELKKSLVDIGRETVVERGRVEWFRLPIDRAFTIAGHGTVVTGSVIAGSVSVDEELDWHRLDGSMETVRVRALNRHGRSVARLERGQRGAINLAGVPLEQVRRGQELAKPGYLIPSRVLSVKLRALAVRPIPHRLPVRLHIGTAEVHGTVSILDGDRIDPESSGFAQFFLDEQVTAVWGQPFVVRDSSAESTLGGGIVLQPRADKIRRRHLEQLERIEASAGGDELNRADAAVWFAENAGLSPMCLVREAGIAPDRIGTLVAELIATRRIGKIESNLVHALRMAELSRRLVAGLGELHAEFPLHTNHERSRVLGRVNLSATDSTGNAVIDLGIREKVLIGDRRKVARADFKPKLSANQRKLKERIVQEHAAAGFQPPEPNDYLKWVANSAKSLAEIFEVACAEGELIRIAAEIWLHESAHARIRNELRRAVADREGLTVAEIRDALGTTRKYAIPLCEYLDRAGVTRRVGDLRLLVAD